MNVSQDFDSSKKMGKNFDDFDRENSQLEILKMQKAMKSKFYTAKIIDSSHNLELWRQRSVHHWFIYQLGLHDQNA